MITAEAFKQLQSYVLNEANNNRECAQLYEAMHEILLGLEVATLAGVQVTSFLSGSTDRPTIQLDTYHPMTEDKNGPILNVNLNDATATHWE